MATHRHRHGSVLTKRALQHNCRQCHEALSSPFAYCWMCGQRAAGVRWGRLTVKVAVVGVVAAVAFLAWAALTG